MIESITKNTAEKEEDARKKEFIKSFNEEAKKQGVKYRLCLHYKEHIYLYGGLIPFWFNPIARHMCFSSFEDAFKFISPIPKKLFKKIEPVLNKLPQKIKIELEDGEIPAKYQIIKEL